MTYEEFIKALGEKPDQLNQFAGKIDAIGQLSDEEKAAEASRIASELGFEVPASEFALQLINASQELDDEELIKVVGGKQSQGSYCMFDYACHLTLQNCFISNECVSTNYGCASKAAPCYADDYVLE